MQSRRDCWFLCYVYKDNESALSLIQFNVSISSCLSQLSSLLNLVIPTRLCIIGIKVVVAPADHKMCLRGDAWTIKLIGPITAASGTPNVSAVVALVDPLISIFCFRSIRT